MTLPNWLPQAIADSRFGPHGVDLSIPRRHTKSHTGRSHFELIAKLKAEVEAKARAEHDEEAKRTVNRDRASGSTRAGQ